MELTAENKEMIVEVKKPYELKELEATDVFVVIRLINKVGIENFKKVLTSDTISQALSQALSQSNDNDENKTNMYGQIGMIVFDIVGLLLERIEDCEHELHAVLSHASNLTVEEVKTLKAPVFMQMIVDFIHKKELVDFCKVALTLLK